MPPSKPLSSTLLYYAMAGSPIHAPTHLNECRSGNPSLVPRARLPSSMLAVRLCPLMCTYVCLRVSLLAFFHALLCVYALLEGEPALMPLSKLEGAHALTLFAGEGTRPSPVVASVNPALAATPCCRRAASMSCHLHPFHG